MSSKEHTIRGASNESPRVAYTREKIKGFRNLPRGWHFGEGVPAGPVVVRCALELLGYAAAQGFRRTNAFFGVEGEISLTTYHGDRYLELVVGEDGSADWTEEKGDEEIGGGEGLTVEEAKRKIDDLRERVWASLGLSTSHGGTTTRIGSTAALSLAIVTASQPSTGTALARAAAASASTLSASTHSTPEALLPTGRSLTEPLRTHA